MASRSGAATGRRAPVGRLASTLATVAVVAGLAGGCNGSQADETGLVETDLGALTDLLSPASTSAPVDVSDRIVRDGPTDETEGAAGESTPGAAVGDGAPDPAAPIGPVAPLTGAVTAALAPRRAVAVKVDNDNRRARPQEGLTSADVVYEELIEAPSTRFLAVFHSEVPDRIGPVRSARSGDFDLLADLRAPYLVTSGANSTVLRQMRQAEQDGILVDVGGLRIGHVYARDRSRPAPHNFYFHYRELLGDDPDALPGGEPEAPPEPLFIYGEPATPDSADRAGVRVIWHRGTGNIVSHIWDAAVAGWVRLHGGELFTAETDAGVVEVAPANVVVVTVPYQSSAAHAESPQAISYGTGDALVLTAGSVHQAVWQRTEDRAGFRFIDLQGGALPLSPGSTWVLLANESRRFPVTETEVLTAAEGAQLLAEARAAAQS